MALRTADAAWLRSGANDDHLLGLRDIAAGPVDGVFYATTRPGGAGVAALRLEADGRMTRFDMTPLPDGAVAGIDSAITWLETPAGERIMVTGTAAGLWSVRTEDAGRLAASGGTASAAPLPVDVTALHMVAIGGRTHLYAARTGDARVQEWEISAEGLVVDRTPASQGPGAGAGGLVDIAHLSHGDRTWLLAAGTGPQALVAHGVGADGRVRADDTVSLGEALGIATPTALVSAVVAGQTYAVLAAAGSGTLSVFTAGPGGIVATDHVMDSLETRFASVTVLETVRLRGATYVAAAGADDGLTLFQLLPGGRLLHVASFADRGDLGLADITGLALVDLEGLLGLVAVSEDEPGATTLRVPAGAAGVTRLARAIGDRIDGGAGDDVLAGGQGQDDLRGGSGDDILVDGRGRDTLTGGVGADVFVFDADGVEDRVRDFEPGIDRIDLSAWPFLRDAEQLDIRSTGSGAVITFGEESLRLDRAGGGSISAADILAGNPIPLGRVLPAWLDGIVLDDGGETEGGGNPDGGTGVPRPRIIEGDGRRDRLTGSAEAEILRGLGGNDTLTGGGGGDTMEGGDGADSFVLRPSPPQDAMHILDFDRREGDRLVLDDLFFRFGQDGDDIRAVTRAEAQAARRSHKVDYDLETGEFWIDRDGARGSGAPVLVAVLEGGPGFTYEDVMLL